MNWYDAYKRAMALPQEVPNEYVEYGGVERIDLWMSDDTAKQEKNKNPGLSFCGSGANGLVYDIGNGRVVKYTLSVLEADKAKILMSNNGDYPVPKIYSVNEVQNKNGRHIWAITMEKMKLLDRKYWDVWDFIINWRKHAPNGWGAEIDEVMVGVNKYVFSVISQSEKRWMCEESLRFKKLDALDLLWDAKGRNIGINSEGHLVLLDLG